MATFHTLWRNYLTNGQAEGAALDLRRVEFVTLFTLVGIPVFSVFGYLNALSGSVVAAAIEGGIVALLVLNVLVLRVTRNVALATSVMLAVVGFALLFLLFDGGIANTGLFWFAVFPALAFFLKDKREGLGWVFLLLLATLVVVAASAFGFVEIPFATITIRQMLATYLVVTVLVYFYADINEKNEALITARDKVLAQTVKKLDGKNRALASAEKEAATALKAAEDEREKFQFQVWETKKFAEAAAFSDDGIIMTTPEGIIVYVNPAWQKITGYSFDEVMGANPRILSSGLTPSAVFKEMWATLGRGESFTTEALVNKRKDGSTYEASLAVYPIHEDQRVVFYVGIQQDITQRKAVERAKSEFVSLASHQLRTPLSTVSWYAEMLKHGDVGKLTKEQSAYVEEIMHGTDRMIELVGALLNVSRLELGTFAVTPEPTDLTMLLQDVLRELKPHLDVARHRLQTNIEPGLPSAQVDPKVMRMVFQNVLTNAVKYTPPSGRITVWLKRDGKALHLIVEDSGIGIPKEQQGRVFQKMFRADNARQKVADGTGLGLYLARAIVEESQGRIWFTSAENQGTTFHITLPCVPAHSLDKVLAK